MVSRSGEPRSGRRAEGKSRMTARASDAAARSSDGAVRRMVRSAFATGGTLAVAVLFGCDSSTEPREREPLDPELVAEGQEIFRFEREGIGQEGEVVGQYRATGIRPRFTERLRTAGIELPTALFSNVGTVSGGRR